MSTYSINKRSGFSLVEVVVALFFVTLAVFIVGTLSKQVMNLSKSSKQVGTVVELQNRTNALLTDPTGWLTKMRVSEYISKDLNGKSVFAGCLSDSLNSATYDCPDHDATIIDPANGDPNIIAAAQGYNAVSYSEIVDRSNKLIAGTDSSPVYLHSDGRLCEDDPLVCKNKAAFKSVGYFLRQFDGDINPGNVKFVVKVEKNVGGSSNQNTLALKPKYISMDVGKSWEYTSSGGSTVSNCPVTTPALIKVGYLNDGTPQCIQPTSSCSSGTVQVGVLPGGEPKCETIKTCAVGERLILDPVSHGLVCTSGGSNPCEGDNVHVGYYAGTGAPICENPTVKCGSESIDDPATPAIGDMISVPSVQMGENSDETPICVAVPPCPTSTPMLSFNGTAFSCVAAVTPTSITPKTCPAGQAVVKINEDGTSECGNLTSTPPVGCTPDQISLGTDADGNEVCEDPKPGYRCAAGTFLVGIDDNGAPICEEVKFPVVSGPSGTCTVGQYVVGFDSAGKIVCQGGPSTKSIKTVTKDVILSSPMCLVTSPQKCERTVDLASHFPEISGGEILSLTLANYGYTKYLSANCNTRVKSLTVSPASPNQSHKFFTLNSNIELNASAQTLKITNGGTTKDGAGKPCIYDGRITIQYQ